METRPGDLSRLLWGVVAVVAAVILGMGFYRVSLGDDKADAVELEEPVFVEVALGQADPVVYRLGRDTTLASLCGILGLPVPGGGRGSRILESGDALSLQEDGTASFRRMDGRKRMALGLKIPLNEAGEADLAAIPGIGPKLAERLVRDREARNGFRSYEDLVEVKGVGAKSLEILRAHTSL
jgi:competence ComEA-like helix-hairpin-helix protein